jgi:hypothetical protein
MDSAMELTMIFRVPLLWCAFFLCISSGLLSLASPRVLHAINSAWTKPVDSQGGSFLDKKIDADSFLLRHARIFGVCALATGIYLFCQIA